MQNQVMDLGCALQVLEILHTHENVPFNSIDYAVLAKVMAACGITFIL